MDGSLGRLQRIEDRLDRLERWVGGDAFLDPGSSLVGRVEDLEAATKEQAALWPCARYLPGQAKAKDGGEDGGRGG